MSALAFADDILLVSDTFEGLQGMVRQTEAYSENVDMVINPSTSQYFGWRINHYTHGKQPSSLAVSGPGSRVHCSRSSHKLLAFGIVC